MKFKNIFGIILLAITSIAMSCDDDAVNLRSQSINLLTRASWGHAKVTHADGDLSNQYFDFAVVFTDRPSDGFDGTFVISNGGSAFNKSAGNWKFSADLTKIVLDSNLEIDYTLQDSKLTLEFITAPSGGRVKGLSGHFIFELVHL